MITLRTWTSRKRSSATRMHLMGEMLKGTTQFTWNTKAFSVPLGWFLGIGLFSMRWFVWERRLSRPSETFIEGRQIWAVHFRGDVENKRQDSMFSHDVGISNHQNSMAMCWLSKTGQPQGSPVPSQHKILELEIFDWILAVAHSYGLTGVCSVWVPILVGILNRVGAGRSQECSNNVQLKKWWEPWFRF